MSGGGRVVNLCWTTGLHTGSASRSLTMLLIIPAACCVKLPYAHIWEFETQSGKRGMRGRCVQ